MLYLLIGYLFLFIYRPFEIWPTLATFRIELVYMVPAIAIWLAVADKRVSLNSMVAAVSALAFTVLFCSFASPWSDRSWEVTEPWFKFLIFFFMLVTSIHDEKGLQRLIIAFLAIMALYMLHSLWEFHCGRFVNRMGINRMVGIDSTNGDPNAFGMSCVLSLVFIPACWRHFTEMWHRAALLGYLALAMLCISLTGSRGAFVGLVVFMLVAVWRSPWRNRLAALLIPAAPVLFLALPPSLQNRFETIINSDVGPKNAKQSADIRYQGFQTGLQLWQANPLTGVGPGCWRPATGHKLESHCLYGQVPGELGTLGVLSLGGVVLAYLINLWQIRRAYRARPEWPPDFLYDATNAIGLALALLLLGGVIGHNLFRAHWILYAAWLIIARACITERIAKAATAASWTDDREEDAIEGDVVVSAA